MLKKLIATAAAAAAITVPFAGVAWAEPSDQGNEGGIGQGGMPARINDIAQNNGIPDPNGPDEPNTVGSVINAVKDAFPDARNAPEAYGDYLDSFYPGVYPDRTPPGLGAKAAGPGCNRGHTAADLGQAGNCPR